MPRLAGSGSRAAAWRPLRAVIGALTFVLMLVWFVVCVLLFLPGALLRLLWAGQRGRRYLTGHLEWIAGRLWMGGNRAILRVLHGRQPRLVLPDGLESGSEAEPETRRSWLLVCNHQSWVDILILLDLIDDRVPFPRFFVKRELLWVPLLGLVCWALDMPFMRRDGGNAQADLVATRRACARYREQPVTLVNFVEGTRYTPAKRDRRGAPYRHLLRPKAGGLAFALGAMGDQFAGLLDVTIAYAPSRGAIVWSFLCGAQREVQVRVQRRPLPDWLRSGDYAEDRDFRLRFQGWVNALWAEKDRALETLRR